MTEKEKREVMKAIKAVMASFVVLRALQQWKKDVDRMCAHGKD